MGLLGIAVLHADPHLLVLDKPAGLLSVPGRGPENADCLSARAQQHYPDALVVHRLDMATSGLLIMARGAAAQRALSRAFAERRVHKSYVAVANGTLPLLPDWQDITLPLIVDWPRRPRSKVCHDTGKPSHTRWRALAHETWPTAGGLTHGGLEHGGLAATRVELEPVTGRSHQLRVHLMATGHPLLGDELYAEGDALAAAPRLLLHASRITLPHPHTGEPLHFHSAVPF